MNGLRVDDQCRITVVGERRRVNLAVPAAAPIATYIDTLARLCAESGNDIMPPAWSLATATTGPFAPERSLNELGIADGQILYLRDVIAGELGEPVVQEVEVRAGGGGEPTARSRWSSAARVVTVTAVGVGWLVAGLVALALRHGAGAGVLVAQSAAFGVVLPVAAWAAARRRWPVPAGLRGALALSAVPLLALAAGVFADGRWGARLHGPHHAVTLPGLVAVAVAVGAVAGALLAYAAAPGVAAAAVFVVAFVAVAAGVLLAGVKADGVEVAGVVAVVAFVLIASGPAVVGGILGFVARRGGAAGDGAALARGVWVGTSLLLLWSGVLAAVVAVGSAVLGASRSPYAAGAAACLGCGLLLRAGAGRLTAEAVPVGVAGVVGPFTLLVTGPGRLAGWHWAAPLGLMVIAVAVVGYGFVRLVRGVDASSPRRGWWSAAAGSLLGGGAIVLVIGIFGVYGHFVTLGHHL